MNELAARRQLEALPQVGIDAGKHLVAGGHGGQGIVEGLAVGVLGDAMRQRQRGLRLALAGGGFDDGEGRRLQHAGGHLIDGDLQGARRRQVGEEVGKARRGVTRGADGESGARDGRLGALP